MFYEEQKTKLRETKSKTRPLDGNYIYNLLLSCKKILPNLQEQPIFIFIFLFAFVNLL